MTKNIVGIILLIAVLALTYHNVTLSERYDMLEKRVEMQNKKSMRDSAISTSNGMILEKYVSANYNENKEKKRKWLLYVMTRNLTWNVREMHIIVL